MFHLGTLPMPQPIFADIHQKMWGPQKDSYAKSGHELLFYYVISEDLCFHVPHMTSLVAQKIIAPEAAIAAVDFDRYLPIYSTCTYI